ncbi:permease [Clostridium sp. TW13]|uniref:Permease n=2 Tax=Inconstantimicrobium mannanitabidum TaxID=1604901 RepID=A0ACB5R886_9CLOT|nr:MFS transporter [Clostridium sp. TW13]GKX65241.1 permease [Clostridium sp. TW13]
MYKCNKEEKSWILYDCTISTYSMILITSIFPLYLRMVLKNNGVSEASTTVYWGYLNSIGRFLIAILAPILGTIADYRGYKIKFFKIFCIIGIVATGLLGIIPDSLYIVIAIIFTISTIGNSGSNVFYDAFLVDVTDKKNMDMISSIGFAAGYIGDIISLALCMVIVLLAQKNIIPIDVATACRICFIITAIWCLLFSIPMIKNVKQVYGIDKENKVVTNSFKRLGKTLSNIRNHKNIFTFLLAYFFYIDGVNTIITMATSFGSDLGISSSSMLLVLLLIMFVAFPSSIIYGKLAEKHGAKIMLYAGIIIYSVICVYAYFIHNITGFMILAVLVGTSQGGVQAISRSYFGKLVPKEKNNEFFGFFNVFGRFAAILGPALVSLVTSLTGKTSNGVFSVLALFILGGLILTKVEDVKIKDEIILKDEAIINN